jgi:hypothetical protein
MRFEFTTGPTAESTISYLRQPVVPGQRDRTALDLEYRQVRSLQIQYAARQASADPDEAFAFLFARRAQVLDELDRFAQSAKQDVRTGRDGVAVRRAADYEVALAADDRAYKRCKSGAHATNGEILVNALDALLAGRQLAFTPRHRAGDVDLGDGLFDEVKTSRVREGLDQSSQAKFQGLREDERTLVHSFVVSHVPLSASSLPEVDVYRVPTIELREVQHRLALSSHRWQAPSGNSLTVTYSGGEPAEGSVQALLEPFRVTRPGADPLRSWF